MLENYQYKNVHVYSPPILGNLAFRFFLKKLHPTKKDLKSKLKKINRNTIYITHKSSLLLKKIYLLWLKNRNVFTLNKKTRYCFSLQHSTRKHLKSLYTADTLTFKKRIILWYSRQCKYEESLLYIKDNIRLFPPYTKCCSFLFSRQLHLCLDNYLEIEQLMVR